MAKKDFSNLSNPALQFITGAETHNAPGTEPTPKEKRDKRLNLLITPALAEDLKKIATMQQRSINELINIVLKDYAISESETIAKYDDVFKK